MGNPFIGLGAVCGAIGAMNTTLTGTPSLQKDHGPIAFRLALSERPAFTSFSYFAPTGCQHCLPSYSGLLANKELLTPRA